jgi:LysR family glycine cleavage system transcriptional activator
MLERRQLPLNAMRAFETVARHLHMRKAAQELGVTHGAVSRQVKLLEQQLGVLLFDRVHNRIELTAGGQRLFKTVQDAFDSISESTYFLNPDSMTGSLIIDATPSIAVNWLLPLVGEFANRYPEIDIRLRNIMPQQAMLNSDFDVALCYGKPLEPAWPSSQLYRDSQFPVASPKLLQRYPAVKEARDLLQMPLLQDRHDRWRDWFSSQGIDEHRGNANLYLQEAYQALAAAREGFGIALADQLDVARDLETGVLVGLSDETVWLPEAIYLVTAPEGRLTQRAKLFIDYLTKWLDEAGALSTGLK